MRQLRKSKPFGFSFDLEDEKQVEVLEAFASLAKGRRASALCNLVRSIAGESATKDAIEAALKRLVYGPIQVNDVALERATTVAPVTLAAVESPREPDAPPKKWTGKLTHLAATASE